MKVAVRTVLLSFAWIWTGVDGLNEYLRQQCPSLKHCYIEDDYGPHEAHPNSLTHIPSGTYNFVCDLTGVPTSPVLFVYHGITHQESRPPYRIKDLYLPCGTDLVVTVSLPSYDYGHCFDATYHISVLACSQCNYECPPYSRPIPYCNCYDSFNDCECIEGYYKNGNHCVAVHTPRPPVPTVPISYYAPNPTSP